MTPKTSKYITGNPQFDPYLFGLCLLVVGLTLSPFLMSIAQFWLVAVWLAHGVNFKQPFKKILNELGHSLKAKLKAFLHNKAAVACSLLYILHVVGLLWTSDFAYAMKDLRIKLPLLLLPIVMSTMPQLHKRQTKEVLGVYVLSVLVATILSFVKYTNSTYNDIREISTIISHIRFSLNILLAMTILAYCIAKEKRVWIRLTAAVAFIWLTLQIYVMQVMSAYVILAALIISTFVYAIVKSRMNKKVKVTLAAVGIAIVSAVAVWSVKAYQHFFKIEEVDIAQLPTKTELGNTYLHDTLHYQLEDGRYTGLYYCQKELRQAWNARSTINFYDTVKGGHKLEYVLLRYMTSKNLTKDAAGMAQMSDEDIANVENCIANYNYLTYSGPMKRLSVLAMELNRYRRNGNPNGGSVSQRIEYFKASRYLISKKPLLGVGTGDIPNAFQNAYNDINSALDAEHRYKAHNQYVSITVGFGLIGLAIFLFSLLYPFFKSKNRNNYLYISFLLIILLSMLPEDTIETQAGATFFAFFNTFFLFATSDEKE